MTVINERAAWKIVAEYVEDCLRIDCHSLLAIYVIGSLSGGYYRPGQSDIDAVLIVRTGSRSVWGDTDKPSKALQDLNRRYLERYVIPKDFGPFALQERELFPPYDPEKCLTCEIARLKLQGKCV